MIAARARRYVRNVVGTAITVALNVAVVDVDPAKAGKRTCITGTDPEVANDLAQIAAVRLFIETSCECSSPDSVNAHGDYVNCAKDALREAYYFLDDNYPRRECLATVKKYYVASTCGVPRSKAAVPCVTKSASGKVSCAIKPAAKCKGVPCTDFTTCVDAADTNSDGLIGAGDSGACGSENLIPNGSVESGALGAPVPWETFANPSGAVTFTWDDTVAQEGALSLKVASSAVQFSAARWSQVVTLAPQTVYRFSGWVKTESVGGDYGASLSLFLLHNPFYLEGTNDWTRFSLTFNSENWPVAIVWAGLGAPLGGNGGTGTAWFDNLRLVALPGGAQPPTPTASATPSRTPTAPGPVPPTFTFTRTSTVTPTPTRTHTLAPGAPTYTVTPTATRTPTATATPSNSRTHTPTSTPTRTHTHTPASTHTPTPDPVGCCALPFVCWDSSSGGGPASCPGIWRPQQHCGPSCVPGTPAPPPTPTQTATPDPRFIDNGDGTISDLQTGLMWEKKDDAGGIHDKDNYYEWCLDANNDAVCDNPGYLPDGGAFTEFLATLNTPPCFAGHCDWRLPTIGQFGGFSTGQAAQLETILLAPYPCATSPCVPAAFNTNCTPGCSATGCSCTVSYHYWCGPDLFGGDSGAFQVSFHNGRVGASSEWNIFFVRAVR